ncbi:MAG TPA: AI-2E family transporter [Gemmatimonadaceae bacterium]|nr:AI-2E family transporter [Gemmatimonadaceae bacterium]
MTTPTPPAAPNPEEKKYRRKRQVGWQSRDVVRAAALAMGLYWLARLVWVANPLFLTCFLGILFGLAVSSGVDRLERFRIPRGVAAGLIVLTFIGALVGFGVAVAPTLREQGSELQRKIPESIDQLEKWIAKKQRGPLGVVMNAGGNPPDTAAPARGGQETTGVVPPGAQVPANPVAGVAGAGTKPADSANGAVKQPTLRERLGAQIGSATRYLFPFLHSTVAAVAGLLLIIFMAIYIAADPDLYHRGLIKMFPRRHRSRAGEVLSAIAGVLRKWLVTQLIAMTVIGVVTTIVLLILDVKAAFALGVIAGLLEFVPTVGPIMSAVPAIAMAFLDTPEKAGIVALAYIGIQFLENHLLIPLLMKGGMDLPPALTILAQALMALLFGFIGLMCAVPLLAAGMVAVKMLYMERVIGEPAFPNADPHKGVV